MALTEKIHGVHWFQCSGTLFIYKDGQETRTFLMSENEAIIYCCCFFPQINLLRRMRVTGLITQGAKRIGSPEYVKSYKVAYSNDGKTWRTYKVKGKDEDMVRHVWAHKPEQPLSSVQSFPLTSHSNTWTKTHTHTHAHTVGRDCALSQGQGGGHDEMAF